MHQKTSFDEGCSYFYPIEIKILKKKNYWPTPVTVAQAYNKERKLRDRNLLLKMLFFYFLYT